MRGCWRWQAVALIGLMGCDDGTGGALLDGGSLDGTRPAADVGGAFDGRTGPPMDATRPPGPDASRPDATPDAAVGCEPACPSGRICVDGACAPAPCAADADCPGGWLCDASGHCADRCGPEAACPQPRLCADGRCVDCAADADCAGAHRICVQSACVDGCRDDDECELSGRCVQGRCPLCAADADCAADRYCAADGACRDGCRVGECPEGARCQQGICVECVADDGCAPGSFCDAMGACADGCREDAHCPPQMRCERGACVAACPPDAFEPDDDPATAGRPAVPGRVADHALCPEDRDLYAVVIPAGVRLEASLDWADVVDLGLRVLDGEGAVLLERADDARPEALLFPPAGEPPMLGLVFVEVAGAVAGRTPYTLDLAWVPEPCQPDARDPGDDLPAGAAALDPEGAPLAGRICPGDRDWARLDLLARDGLGVEVRFTGDPLTFSLAPEARLDPPAWRVDQILVEGEVQVLRFDADVGAFTDGPWLLELRGAAPEGQADYTITAIRRRLACDPADCPPAEPCREPACDAEGACVLVPRPEGTPCPDDDQCNGLETCVDGACRPASPLDCATGVDPCLSTDCEPAIGCVRAPRPDGSSCADEDVCDGEEVCLAGACVAGEALECPPQGPCTQGVCDPELGRCVQVNLADGTPCPDADRCDGDEICREGVCAPGEPVACPGADACNEAICDPAAGCGVRPRPDETPCPDGDACNGDELCVAGRCVAGEPPVCPGDACNDGVCAPAAGCGLRPVPDGQPCGDGDVCNGDEICRGGVCAPGEALVCPAPAPCQAVTCDAEAGCEVALLPDGAACGDPDACNGEETCQAGECVAGAPPECGESDACVERGCNSVDGCFERPRADGTACGDPDACNGAETCQAGECVAGAPPECGESDACVERGCNSVDGCFERPHPDGTACGDADVCNGAEVCRAGQCVAGAPLDCGADDPCTDRGCDPAGGCFARPINEGQVCADDGNVCTDQICRAGQCVVRNNDNGCDNANVCDGVDACRDGRCVQVQAPPNCGGDDACNDRGCDARTGCFVRTINEGRACADDGNTCTQDVCRAGACRKENANQGRQCGVARNICHQLVCDAGRCATQSIREGQICHDDRNLCTEHHCRAGSCRLENQDGRACDDGNACTTESCAGGACRVSGQHGFPQLNPGGVIARQPAAPGNDMRCNRDDMMGIQFCLPQAAAVNLRLDTRVNGRGWLGCPQHGADRCNVSCAEGRGDAECQCQRHERVCAVVWNPETQGVGDSRFWGCSHETNDPTRDPRRGDCGRLDPPVSDAVLNLPAGPHQVRLRHICHPNIGNNGGPNVDSITTESVRLRLFQVNR